MLCVAFAENGDAITGDSSGNIYVWAKGLFEDNRLFSHCNLVLCNQSFNSHIHFITFMKAIY